MVRILDDLQAVFRGLACDIAQFVQQGIARKGFLQLRGIGDETVFAVVLEVAGHINDLDSGIDALQTLR